MPKSLAHLIDEVPPTNPQSVPDSCSEESSDDEVIQPKPLNGGRSVPGGSRGRGGMVPLHAPIRGGDARVEATVGRGGKLVYQTVRTGLPAWYYNVQWRKPQTKKHKTWDGDAIIKIEGNKVTMLNESGEHMATATYVGGPPSSGNDLRIGPYECEVDSEISFEEFKTATCILNKPAPKAMHVGYAPSTYAKPFKPPTQTSTPRPVGGYIPARVAPTPADAESDDDAPRAGPSRLGVPVTTSSAGYKAISATNFYGAPKPKVDKIVIGEKSRKRRMEWGGALHDPNAEGAVVMQRPSANEAKQRKTSIVDVVLDPFLTSKMRDHQKEGVKFMYSCVMGLTEAEANGCILADEMGLGKTLQTIALIYTLLKQSPFENQNGVIGKALVVCPVSLVENWKKEFRKWIRPDQLSVVAADANESAIRSFTHHRGQHVLIIGYERLRKVIKQLASCQPPIDLIVCDEGHRLKSKDNKTTKMFEALRTNRRIILSGTPVQNDLSEYFAMVDFTCPGLLGTYAKFVKHYEKPIMKSRTPGCKGQALQDGRDRADELGKLSKEFVLRRTAQVLENYLPPKHEYVVFVAPSVHQLNAYGRILNTDFMAAVIRGETDKQPLGYIDLMRKIANTPTILRMKKQDDASRSENIVPVTKAALQDLPSDMNNYDVAASGKLSALDKILHALFHTTAEKVVIVSNFVITLNIIQEICKARRYPHLRLDGSTPQKQRQEVVESFNKQRREESFVFLLSAKAGGVGLNLIGASRLILFDSDWNPSTDLQAMARIHRDGQKKPVFIYRFLTTNTIDEKIYQRQITKTGLADQMMDQNATQERTKDSFTAAELRDIFKANIHTDGCQTHDLLLCNCTKVPLEVRYGLKEEKASENGLREEDGESDGEGHRGFVPATLADPEPTPKMLKKAATEQREKLAALREWTHMDGFDKASFGGVADTLLYNMMWEAWGEHGPISGDTNAAVTEIPDENGSDMAQDSEPEDEADESEDNVVDEPQRAKNRLDLLFLSDEEFDGALKGALKKHRGKQRARNLDGDSEAESDGGGEDESNGEAGKKRKSISTTRTSSRSRSASIARSSKKKKVEHADTAIKEDKGKGKRKSVDVLKSEKKQQHDLRAIAEAGQGGRIMFVFEKISQSRM